MKDKIALVFIFLGTLFLFLVAVTVITAWVKYVMIDLLRF